MAEATQKFTIEFTEEGLALMREANQSLRETLVETRKLKAHVARLERAMTHQSKRAIR